MKNSVALEILVGVFVLLGFVALAFLAIQVSGLSQAGSAETYQVSARFTDVGGLTERAKVSMGGVTIGRVTDISLDQTDFMAVVTMDIESKYDQLTADATARILTSGVLGEKYIGLSPGAEDIFLEEGDEIEYTQSSLVLEDLIGKFLVNQAEKE